MKFFKKEIGEPSSKAKYEWCSDSEKYREGKMKRKSMTSEIDSESAIIQAVKAIQLILNVITYLLHNGLASYF